MENNVSFAPVLYIQNGIKDISFYEKAFGAIEQMRFSNEDGSLHVAELSVDGAVFYVHEVSKQYWLAPVTQNATSVCIGLFAPDVDVVMDKAIQAGATEISPAQDYGYGYRQGMLKDPFGHYWQIQKRI